MVLHIHIHLKNTPKIRSMPNCAGYQFISLGRRSGWEKQKETIVHLNIKRKYKRKAKQ